MDKTRKEMVIGAVAGTGVDTVIDGAVAQLTGGKLPVVQYWDPNGKYIWGFGLGDVVGAGIGGAAYMVGGKLKNYGKGWLIALGVLKAVELIQGIREAYIRPAIPYTEQRILGAGTNGNRVNGLYAGPENPQPSPFAPAANPQGQLMIGSKGGRGPVGIYKPNVSAPACAGSNAANQQLFV